MSDDSSALFPLLVSREQAENKLGETLRLYVGRGRRYSVKQLSNATGVKDRAIECAMHPSGTVDYRPLNLGQILSLMKFLGTDFTNELLSLVDQVAIERPEDMPYESVASLALDYVTTHIAARDPNSPAGSDIAPCEAETLGKKASNLAAVAA